MADDVLKADGPVAMRIRDRWIGPGHPAYFIAEISANHGGSFERAARMVELAAEAGADAVKLQTYTADTLTIDADNEHFRISGTLWDGRSLHDLYGEAYMPWEWQPRLLEVADRAGITLFSTPFDSTAIDFLEEMGVAAHKIASFEIVDLPLLRGVAATGKPVILSTGMATLAEIDEAVTTLRQAGCTELALLKCTSAYPAPPESMNLQTIPALAAAFGVVAGLSDHSLDQAVPVTAVALGASIVEKHFTLSREEGGPDSGFSLEPEELKATIQAIRVAEKAMGRVSFGAGESESATRVFRRSLFVVQDVPKGAPFTVDNVRSIRPGSGLHTRYLEQVVGRVASRAVERGTPMSFDLMAGSGS